MQKKICLFLALLLLFTASGTRYSFPFGVVARAELSELTLPAAPEDTPPPDITSPEPEPELEPEPEPEPEPGPEPTPPFHEEPQSNPARDTGVILEPHQRVVYTFAQLESALTDSTTTELFFGSDIELTGGIHINPGKIHLRISGIDPNDPLRVVHTLTERDSTAQIQTIYLAAVDTRMLSLTVSDLNIIGKNYFGPFSVFDGAGMTKLLITYERVTYDGPQIGYNRQSTIRLVDSVINLHGGNGTSHASEYAEAKHLVFAGNNTITTVANAQTTFWHVGGGTFRLEDGARLNLRVAATAPTYCMFYADAFSVNITVGEGAVFDIETTNAMSRTDGKISGLTVEAGGTFSMRTTATRAMPALHMTGPISIAEGGSFQIYGASNPLYDLLRQEGGGISVARGGTFHLTAAGQYASLLHLFGQTLYCDDPASVVMAGTGRTLLSSGLAATQLDSRAQQYAYWNMLVPSGPDNPPPHRWVQYGDEPFALSATVSNGSTGGFTALTSSYTPPHPPGIAPSSALLNLSDMRVFAFGRLPLTVTPPLPGSAITGKTAPGASVRAVLITEEGNRVLADGFADAGGSFRLQPDLVIDSGGVIVVESVWNYLAAQEEVMVLSAGSLEISVPASLPFHVTPLSAGTLLVERAVHHWHISVSDTRVNSPGWQLYARLGRELSPANPDLPVVHDAVAFVTADGTVLPLRYDTELLIAQHIPAVGAPDHTISWPDDRGLLLVIPAAMVYADTPYTATISWVLEDTP